LRQIINAGELVSCEHTGNLPIEALHHAIRSGRAWRGQAVFNAQGLAQFVKFMVTRGLALSAFKQPVAELLVAVGQNFLHLIGQVFCKALRYEWAAAAVLWLLICTNTQPVARSIATNRKHLLVSSGIWGMYLASMWIEPRS
tara:strand:- start:110 stop:535 length:426 start_codon:yes stop_codon:yes gene_type:complete